MRTTRILIAAAALVAASAAEADAQRFLDRLGKAAERAAENAVIRQAERRTEEAVNKTIDGTFDAAGEAVRGDGENAEQQQQQVPPAGTDAHGDAQTPAGQVPQGQSLEMTYAKSDFVPGDEIIFDDNLASEKLGEFPSMWDLKSGNAEVANVGGENAIHLEQATTIMPFMKEKDYLPDVFTIEFDLFIPNNKGLGLNCGYNIDLMDANGNRTFQYRFAGLGNTNPSIYWSWKNNGEGSSGSLSPTVNHDVFYHIAISFNKRALKFYMNGERVVNIPRCDVPTRFQIYGYQGVAADNRFVKNVRIAKGAVPLYDRMMSEGKFITYGITFDVGKATIKPESMGEINRIVTLMTENPDLRFSVEGHTDSTGNAAGNQTLSEQRSAAIVAKLTELGIAADRLTASGKGAAGPIADNATDEGRAKNRRVEFVKQ